MKPDERELLRYLVPRVEAEAKAHFAALNAGRITPSPGVLELLGSYPINRKRALYLLGKWVRRGWYDFGVCLDRGWFYVEQIPAELLTDDAQAPTT